MSVPHTQKNVPSPYTPTVLEVDLRGMAQGCHLRLYEFLGARHMKINGRSGVRFVLWAPHATRIRILGDFNQWDGSKHEMVRCDHSGVWELFVPSLKVGVLYKFEISGPGGFLVEKADPFALAAELRPGTASKVGMDSPYVWGDAEWMRQRKSRNWAAEPVSIYEVHLGSWRRSHRDENRWLTYLELADVLIPYVKEFGFTHVELLPITEHPLDDSWGYQVCGYFAATVRYGPPGDLCSFIDRCHKEGIGVILDWVPAHFPKDRHGLGFFDGSHLYEYPNPLQGEHMDWGTLIYNYGRGEVRSFLLSSASFWAERYHVDGIRVDAVSSMLYLDYSREEGQWIPNEYGGRENLEAVEFLKSFNEIIHREFPGILIIAEESTAFPMVTRPVCEGGLGFDMKWNMGWMNDVLAYMGKDFSERNPHHYGLTYPLTYAFAENFLLPFSHDEVVHEKKSLLGKMPGTTWAKFANLRLLYLYQFAFPGKKLLFMGQEFAQSAEWDFSASLDWEESLQKPHREMAQFLADLLRVYREQPALYEMDFSESGTTLYQEDASFFSIRRRGGDAREVLLCLFNFTQVLQRECRMGVDSPGAYHEIINSDDLRYGGSSHVKEHVIHADSTRWQDKSHSLVITLAPLSGVVLKQSLSH